MKLLNLIIGAIALVSSTTAAPATFSKDRCGPGYGHCDGNDCCSKYNWCGTSNEHCLISNGCQSEFGACRGSNSNSSNKVSQPSTSTQYINQNNSKVRWAGYRYSPYGPSDSLSRDPTPSEWMQYVKKFKSHFDKNTQGAVLLIVGQEHKERYCEFQFPKPSSISSYSNNIQFIKKDKYESFLSACDQNNINVWLQVEPGSNDLVELAKITLDRYKHHSSVKGFGIDLEWWYRVNSSDGKRISDNEAKRVVNAVRAYNSNYTVFVKHWETEFMPSSYRDHLIFVDDSQDFHGNASKMTKEFAKWAKTFSGSPVMFQVGYKADKNIWGNNPIKIAQDVANAATQYNNQVGIFWVDFTMKYAINK
ncbi:carbohydrate-binding module family 18 protein [Piromyces sp. E2]|nr:carbohydrate-binding module family 18 protein [Piromyces sp. E2]|eukprot:OUM58955.1 carbohydrate-binding module family 18 protein [Piromyces sp. E2]